MKKLLFIFLFTTSATAQSVSFSLPSFDFWGSAKMISEVSVEYKDVSVHYFHSFNTSRRVMSNHEQSSLGLSYTPIKYHFIKSGFILTNKKFPTTQSIKANIIIDIGFNISRVRISYKHISNGFGIVHKPNNGYDTISFTYTMK